MESSKQVKELFAKAKEEGFLLVAHAREEGGSDYIQEALELGVCRIDHGVKCEESEELVEFLRQRQIPLIMCPLSNHTLKVTLSLKDHNLVQLLRKGLCVTINSDDPAYFGGYMNANFEAIYEALNPSKEEIRQISLNALEASFLSLERKKEIEKIILAIC